METPTSSLAGWTPEQIAQGKRWVQTWKNAGEAMEALRDADLQATETPRALMQLAGAFESARFMGAASRLSGLVEQQKLFLRWHLASRG